MYLWTQLHDAAQIILVQPGVQIVLMTFLTANPIYPNIQ
jgi:hypothetical protein